LERRSHWTAKYGATSYTPYLPLFKLTTTIAKRYFCRLLENTSMMRITVTAVLLSVVLGLASVQVSFGDDADELLTIDHAVPHISTMPAIAGQPAS
jgi:hypothetical protein